MEKLSLVKNEDAWRVIRPLWRQSGGDIWNIFCSGGVTAIIKDNEGNILAFGQLKLDAGWVFCDSVKGVISNIWGGDVHKALIIEALCRLTRSLNVEFLHIHQKELDNISLTGVFQPEHILVQIYTGQVIGRSGWAEKDRAHDFWGDQVVFTFLPQKQEAYFGRLCFWLKRKPEPIRLRSTRELLPQYYI